MLGTIQIDAVTKMANHFDYTDKEKTVLIQQ